MTDLHMESAKRRVAEMERQTPHCPECGDAAVKDPNSEVYACVSCGVSTLKPLWYSAEELDLHDTGECRKMSEPCPLCGKSVQDITRGE